jgi:hypothetical protein
MDVVPAKPYRDLEREELAAKTVLDESHVVHAHKSHSLNQILGSIYNLADNGVSEEMVSADPTGSTEILKAKRVAKAIQADLLFLAEMSRKVCNAYLCLLS